MNPELINKYRKPVLITAGIIAAYALIGFIILPAILKSQLPQIVADETGRKATLEQVEFNPFSLEFSLLGFSMQEKDAQTFVSFDKFFVNVQVWSSIKEFALVLDEVSLEGPYARFEMLPEGQYNFSDLSSESDEEEVKEEEDGGGMFPLIINHINLVQGELETVDSLHSKPDSTLIQDLNLHLESFSTLLDDESNLGFSLALNTGGVLDWQGEIGVNPVFSNGKVKIKGLKFARIWKQFLQDKVEFKWQEGTQLVSFDYAFSYANDEASLQLTKGRLLTEGLKFTPKESTEKLIDIPYFLVDDIAFDLNKQTINIAKIESREIDFDAWYNQAGELNMQTAFAAQDDGAEAEKPAPEVTEQQTEPEEAMPWEINIQEIAFTDTKANFVDKRKKQHALINLAALDIGLKNYHLLAGETIQMTAHQGFINLDDLMLKTNQDRKLFHVPNFQINEIDFNLLEQTLGIQSVQSQDVFINAWLEKNGEINYQRLFAATETKNDTQTEPTEEPLDNKDDDKPWNVNIQDIAFNSSSIKFSDKSKEQAVLFDIGSLDIGIKDLDVLASEAMQLTGDQGYLKLNSFELKTKQDPKLIKVPNVQVSGLGFNLQEQRLNIESISSRDAVIKAWLAKNGEINYQTLFAPSTQELAQETPAPAPEATDKGGKPWSMALGEFRIDNYALEFTDQTPQKPVSLNLSALNFSIKQFDNKKGTKLPLSFSTLVNKKGKIKLTGQSVLEPFSSNLDLAVSNIGIRSFQPYINQSAKLNIVGGGFNTQGKLALSMADQGELKLNYKGGMNIKGLHTRDQILKEDFLKWQQLKLSGIDFNLQPGKLKVKAIRLDKPYARVTIQKDKNTNINDVIVAADTAQKKPAKAATKKSAPFFYQIGKVTIEGGESDFSDYSLILPFVVKLNDLDGAIKNISSNRKATTNLNLTGKTFDLSPVEIQGNFDADLDDLDVALHYQSLPLPFLSPYMVEFSGNKIEKGKLSLDLMYKVKDGQLSATNNVLIDQLELGDKVENPDAVDLPLGLAIALLKDKDGKININMPVQGSMDDPDFSLGPVLLDTFINLITKAVASPFTAIGSFLGSDEDFSVVVFRAGSAQLSNEEMLKLDGLSDALQQKSDLSLEIKGEAYTNQDWPAMKEQALLDELKQMRSDELKEEGEMKLPEYIELSEEDYQRLLADLFIQKFPELGERSLFGTPQLIHEDMGEFSTVASNMLQSMIKPDKDKLLILSLTRARNIARYMNTKGKVDHERMFILDGRVTPDSESNELNTNLSLKM